MTLPRRPGKPPRPSPMSFKFRSDTAEQIRTLSREHNITQAEVIENLVGKFFKKFMEKKKKKS